MTPKFLFYLLKGNFHHNILIQFLSFFSIYASNEAKKQLWLQKLNSCYKNINRMWALAAQIGVVKIVGRDHL